MWDENKIFIQNNVLKLQFWQGGKFSPKISITYIIHVMLTIIIFFTHFLQDQIDHTFIQNHVNWITLSSLQKYNLDLRNKVKVLSNTTSNLGDYLQKLFRYED